MIYSLYIVDNVNLVAEWQEREEDETTNCNTGVEFGITDSEPFYNDE